MSRLADIVEELAPDRSIRHRDLKRLREQIEHRDQEIARLLEVIALLYAALAAADAARAGR